MPIRTRLEHYFGFSAHATNWRTEILAGLTTFITMAYIIFVNPAILSETGMPLAAVTAATCLCAAFGSILMGAAANYPLALAPGMGLNAYFTYTVVKAMHVPWQTALGAVFLSGVIFLALTFTGIRQRLVAAIPHQLHAAVGGGIGLFIAFIGFRNAGIIVPSPATTVTLGNLHAPPTILAIFGLLLIAILQVLRIRASMLIGVLATTLLGILCHQVHWQPAPYNLSAIKATAFHLDIRGALHIGVFEIIFVFLFVDLFDNIGTLVAVTQRAGLIAPDHTIPRLNRIFFADATSTILGALTGTSTVTSYIDPPPESRLEDAPASPPSSPASYFFSRSSLPRSSEPSPASPPRLLLSSSGASCSPASAPSNGTIPRSASPPSSPSPPSPSPGPSPTASASA
jgi:AGZA family xanthine/uracil permease-like MFS transporter